MKCFSSNVSIAIIKMKTEFIRGVGEGSLTGDMTGYIQLLRGNLSQCRLLRCYRREADGRFLFDISRTIRTDNFSKIIVAVSNTEIFYIFALYYQIWMRDDFEELFMLYGDRILLVKLCLQMTEVYLELSQISPMEFFFCENS